MNKLYCIHRVERLSTRRKIIQYNLTLDEANKSLPPNNKHYVYSIVEQIKKHNG